MGFKTVITRAGRYLIPVGFAGLLLYGCEESPEPRIEYVTIPAGEFTCGPPGTMVALDYAYEISRYEITNRQYADFLNAVYEAGSISVNDSCVAGWYGGDEQQAAGDTPYCFHLEPANRISWDGERFEVQSGYTRHPVVFVTWAGAVAFAVHHQARLPTANEWEKAARGTTGYAFPWGHNLSGDYGNFATSGDPYESGPVQTTPVGYYDGRHKNRNGASSYGVHDLFGNVEEWTDEWYFSGLDYFRVVRGKSWATQTRPWPAIWQKGSFFPERGNAAIGFRVVR